MTEKGKNKTSSQEEFDRLGKLVFEAKRDAEKQLEELKTLKKDKADKKLIKASGKKYKEMMGVLDKLTKRWRRADPAKLHFSREDFDQFIVRRFFYVPSNEIYGGVSGFYDYGPPACAIKANLIKFWRNHFVIEENMLELDCCTITPHIVFETSGHLDRFFDFMVKDVNTKECHRVDKLIADHFEKLMEDPKTSEESLEKMKIILQTLDDCQGEQFDKIVVEFDVRTPKGNKVSKSFPFNLMFKTTIGPSGNQVGYLRPETAQGIFVNFKRLYDYNNQRLPFAAAQIGKSYRNEISPKSGLLRVREFSQAEIEHFMDPEDIKFHPKFKRIKDLKVRLFGRKEQENGLHLVSVTLEEAMEKGIIKNMTLAYYIGRVYQFYLEMGMLEKGIRFRQHLQSEMAFYSRDCWDLEILTSYGWYEVVGLADRSCYDLTKHQERSEKDLFATINLDEPIIEESWKVDIVNAKKREFFSTFKGDGKVILKHFNSEETVALELRKVFEQRDEYILNLNGKDFKLHKEMFNFKKITKKVNVKKIVPAVIEPSFGIDRSLYCLLEHSFWVREDPEKKNKIPRSVLSFAPHMAPYQVAIVTVTNSPDFDSIVTNVRRLLADDGISHQVDHGKRQIGRKYARLDELGIPFILTIDHDSIKNIDVTIRERDSCTQVRVGLDVLCKLIRDLVRSKLKWEDVQAKFKEQKQTASEKVGKK